MRNNTMEKKLYINPEIEVINVKVQNPLLETSTVGYGGEVNNTDGADGRRDNFDWDE